MSALAGKILIQVNSARSDEMQRLVPVTCVITSFNNGVYLEAAIASALNSSAPPAEILVSDDCSTDGSFERAREIFRSFASVNFVRQSQNVGVSRNRESAIHAAKNDVFTTLDGDDLLCRGKIEREFARIDTGESVVFSNTAQIVGRRGIYIGVLNIGARMSASDSVLRDIVLRNGPIPRDMMQTKDGFSEAGGYDPALCLYEDWDYKIRLALVRPSWSFSSGVGTIYRKHRLGLSSVKRDVHDKALSRVIMKNSVANQAVREVIKSRNSGNHEHKALEDSRSLFAHLNAAASAVRSTAMPDLRESFRSWKEVADSVANARHIA